VDSIEYLKQKYYDLLPRSFKTKLDIYLFYRCLNKGGIGKFKAWEFDHFKIDDEVIAEYEKAWQLGHEDRLTQDGPMMKEIDKEIEHWQASNRNLMESLFKEYKILFITHLFPFSDFESLYSKEPNERICHYCKINDKQIEELSNKGKIKTKRDRGFTMEIDRLEPNKEYSLKNCVLACYWCNNAKSDEFTPGEFSEHIGPGIQSVWKDRNR